MGKNWVFELDYLRVIAIFAVLISHGYGIFGIQALYPLFAPYMGLLGSFGVILFFFISGFLISRIIPENRKSILKSLKDRIVRIGPLYWIALLLTSILFSFHIYQGYWINNFDLYNMMLNALFLINFAPGYDIPPFWFISSLVLFAALYLVLRYICKNPFYYAISSLAVYFLLLTLEKSGLIWAISAFIYFILGTLLGILYNAQVFVLDKITSVHPVISIISASSYPTYLFHLIFFGALVQLFAFVSILDAFLKMGIALILTICICTFIQKGFESLSDLLLRTMHKKSD